MSNVVDEIKAVNIAFYVFNFNSKDNRMRKLTSTWDHNSNYEHTQHNNQCVNLVLLFAILIYGFP